MNLFFCLIGIIAVQQLPMAIAGDRSVDLLKGTRGTSSWRKLDELPKKSKVKGPSKRDCKMCKFQLYGILAYSVFVLFVS
jgi:hypothetical protein